MKKLLLISLILPFLCVAQTGNVSGNVFWKYNNFVGNKADAGSDIYLLSTDTTKKALTTKCDLTGNFKFANLEKGKYLIIVISKNTNQKVEDEYTNLAAAPLEAYIGFNMKSLDPILFDSINIYKEIYQKAETTIGTASKKKDEKRNSTIALNAFRLYLDAISRLRRKIHYTLRTSFLLSALSKMYFEEITIKVNQTSNIVVDFGITAF